MGAFRDDDDPTMVASFRRAMPDDEATQLHPQRAHSDAPPQPAAAPLQAGNDPPLHPQVSSQPYPGTVMANVALAQREAAMNAALAAASSAAADPQDIAKHRARQIDAAIATLLGSGMTLSAVLVYLSAAASAGGAAALGTAYNGLTVLCAIALFAAGMAPLQAKIGARIALIIGSGTLLFFTLLKLLFLAVS